MNERIEKLAKKAGFGVYGEIYSPNDEDSPITKNIEKFAELIVEECVKVAHPKLTDVGEWAAGMRLVQQRLKQHFGVE